MMRAHHAGAAQRRHNKDWQSKRPKQPEEEGLSNDAFMPVSKARMVAADLDLDVNF